MLHVPEKYRAQHALIPFLAGETCGYFRIPHSKIKDYYFHCIVGDGHGWEHVSVTISEKRKAPNRCPVWAEMCWLKDLFWDKTDCAVQYHPAESEYVNMHPFCLHLWRPITEKLPVPPKIMVGI